ncbi:MAG: TIGR04211 family SH3 domain-containing protein [Succinivibrio sp.]
MDKLKLTAAALLCAAAFPAFAQDGGDAAAQGAQAPDAAQAAEGAQAQQEGPQPDENGYYQGAGIYVSDNVNALLRSGPATGYRTTGVLHPGDQVTFSRYSQDKRFIEVVTQDGKKVWMRFDDLQAAPAAKNQLDQLKAENEELRKELEQAQQQEPPQAAQKEEGQGGQDPDAARLKEELSSVKAENASLRKALEDAGAKAPSEAQASAGDTRRELDLQMRWWIQGALIAFGGAVAGIILVMLPKPRGKRRDRY